METPVKLPLGGFIQGSAPLQVPRFQRPYAWTDEEVEDFIQDVDRTARKRRVLQGSAREEEIHFFGGILSTQYAQPDMTPTYVNEVIDGQQRVATVMLALVVLRKAFIRIADTLDASGAASANESILARGLAENIYNNYLTYEQQDLRTGLVDRRQSLTLSQIDANLFRSVIAGSEPVLPRSAPPSHKRIRSAYRALDAGLVQPLFEAAALSDATRLEALRETLIVLTKNFFVIKLYTQANRNEAYQLFMVLNDRGVSLSDAELLRTKSLELLQDSGYENLQLEVASTWDEVFQSSNADVNAFLAAYFASRTGERAPRRNLYDAYLTQIFPEVESFTNEASAEAFRDLIKQLQAEHSAFRAISAGEWPFRSPSVSYWHQKRLERLISVLGRKGDIPLLLAAWSTSPDDDKLFAELVNQMERYGLRWYAAGAHSGSLSEAYYEQAAQLRADPSNYSLQTFLNEVEPFVALHVTEPDFVNGLRTRLRYGTGPSNRIIKHALTTVEDYWRDLNDNYETRHPDLRPGREAAYDLSQVQIEHIYPQEPQVGERDSLLDGVVHHIGNLTFLSGDDNLDASNKPFREKSVDYRGTSSRMTQEIARNKKWAVEDVEMRGTRLLNFLERIYALNDVLMPTTRQQPSYWLIAQKATGSAYEDIFGREYEYRGNLPNGRRVKAGDRFAVLLLGEEKRNRTRQIVAVGEVGTVLDQIAGFRRAIYSRFLELPQPLEMRLDEDPRLNRQHSINRIGIEVFQTYLPPGITVEDLPRIV